MTEKEKNKLMSAQTIFQRCAALRMKQGLLRKNPDDQKIKSDYKRLTKEIKGEIEAWGGIDKIDAWLKENDPGHSLPSNIKGIDWSWLN